MVHALQACPNPEQHKHLPYTCSSMPVSTCCLHMYSNDSSRPWAGLLQVADLGPGRSCLKELGVIEARASHLLLGHLPACLIQCCFHCVCLVQIRPRRLHAVQTSILLLPIPSHQLHRTSHCCKYGFQHSRMRQQWLPACHLPAGKLNVRKDSPQSSPRKHTCLQAVQDGCAGVAGHTLEPLGKNSPMRLSSSSAGVEGAKERISLPSASEARCFTIAAILSCEHACSHVRGARSVSLPAVSNTGTLATVTLAATLCYTWAYEGIKGMAIGFRSAATV